MDRLDCVDPLAPARQCTNGVGAAAFVQRVHHYRQAVARGSHDTEAANVLRLAENGAELEKGVAPAGGEGIGNPGREYPVTHPFGDGRPLRTPGSNEHFDVDRPKLIGYPER